VQLHFVKLHCVLKDLFIKEKWFLFFCLYSIQVWTYHKVSKQLWLVCAIERAVIKLATVHRQVHQLPSHAATRCNVVCASKCKQ